MRRILAIQVVNDMWQRDSTVPVPQGFRGKVDSMVSRGQKCTWEEEICLGPLKSESWSRDTEKE